MPRPPKVWLSSTGEVCMHMSRDHFQALQHCFNIGFEGFPDNYPFGVQAEEVSYAIEQYLQEEEDAAPPAEGSQTQP